MIGLVLNQTDEYNMDDEALFTAIHLQQDVTLHGLSGDTYYYYYYYWGVCQDIFGYIIINRGYLLLYGSLGHRPC